MNRPTPFRFDGHGINDGDGQRICKVECCPTFIETDDHEKHPSGMMLNPEFLELSKTFAAAPSLLEVAKQIDNCIPQKIDDDTVKVTLTRTDVEMLREALRIAKEE